MSEQKHQRNRILIAEDDPVSRRMLQSFLAKWGYEVLAAANGTEAFPHNGSAGAELPAQHGSVEEAIVEIIEVRRIPDGGHVIVCGLSTIGFRTLEELVSYGERVVVIEQDPAPIR